ncbi:MAG: ABC transporter ATP-binding protein, partial [Anaerolineales bacterium]
MPVVHDPKRPEQIVISIDGPAPGVDSGPTLLVESLDFRYPGGRQALRDVSLSISRGDKVALVGPNG